ncbi:MAG: dNTP triphosphohydrolase [Pirellulaceae bacterium]|nr:dNTP triphosphohydrolase [Pirellulaceae bacterium]
MATERPLIVYIDKIMNSMPPPAPGSHLQTVSEREQKLLAPYATFSSQSKGRKQAEPDHPYRGPFQRDRDRIVHSSAYRRLSGKMQVFTGNMGDYHRTRLTHTHEVASIARTMGRALRLNEDLVEALALFHDIGHPPFGHAGEDALNLCLQNDGGFSHNQYALTIAEELEIRDQPDGGLNLSLEVLEGQATRVDKDAIADPPSLEAQVVEAADSITYDAHDADDAVKLGLVTLDELADLPLVQHCLQRIGTHTSQLDPDVLRRSIVHELIDCQVSNVLRAAEQFLQETPGADWQSPTMKAFRIEPVEQLAQQKQELEEFLRNRVYRHPQLLETRDAAQKQLQVMYRGYLAAPELLPPRFRQRAQHVGLPRSVGDYLAGMTDRYCDQQFSQFFDG